MKIRNAPITHLPSTLVTVDRLGGQESAHHPQRLKNLALSTLFSIVIAKPLCSTDPNALAGCGKLSLCNSYYPDRSRRANFATAQTRTPGRARTLTSIALIENVICKPTVCFLGRFSA